MSGSTFGQRFKLTSFGQSHGPAIGGIVDGCPSGIELNESVIQKELDKRKPGSQYTSPRKEEDKVKILSGTFNGKTTGAPICFIIENKDMKPEDYTSIKELFRPGHADYSYNKKYKVVDYRGGGRASARETAVRVAAGAIAQKFLHEKNISISSCVTQIGNIKASSLDWEQIEENPFLFSDEDKLNEIEQLFNILKKEGDSIGAKVCTIAKGVPAGLGEPVYDKLNADIAKAMMSINAVKGVEIGCGYECVTQKGSEHRDELDGTGFLSNNAGGVLGGISTGQDIISYISLKPTSSIQKKGKTIDKQGIQQEISVSGRHDICVGIRAVPVAKAMLSLVLADHYLRYFGYA